MREFYHNRDFRQKIVGASIERVAWFETNISKHLLVKKKFDAKSDGNFGLYKYKKKT